MRTWTWIRSGWPRTISSTRSEGRSSRSWVPRRVDVGAAGLASGRTHDFRVGQEAGMLGAAATQIELDIAVEKQYPMNCVGMPVDYERPWDRYRRTWRPVADLVQTRRMIRTLDLFCGGGGSSYGARAAGATIVCGVDANPLATEVFKENFPEAMAVTLRMTDRTDSCDLDGIGKIDLLLASPECTNHTCARGSRPREETSRATARYVINFASSLTPRWIVVENVVSMRSWSGYRPLLDGLSRLGYESRVQVLDASRFGVPQKRKRLFILCDRENVPPPVEGRRGRPPHARNILDPRRTWPSRPLYKPGRAAATIERAERAISALGPGIPFLIVYYGSDGSGGWQPLDRPLRTITTLDRFGLVTWTREYPCSGCFRFPSCDVEWDSETTTKRARTCRAGSR